MRAPGGRPAGRRGQDRLGSWQWGPIPQKVTSASSTAKPASLAGSRQGAWPTTQSTSATVPQRRGAAGPAAAERLRYL
jgi:hypothetical protein